MTALGVSVAPPRLGDLLAAAAVTLGSESEARWIVAHATGMAAGELVARSDTAVAPALAEAVRDLVDRRLSGQPLQYVLGTWGFRTLEIRVDPRVLIPRPETEQVVTAALEELSARATGVVDDATLLAVDLGTGSGAIALSLATEFVASAKLEVWASDVSVDALELFDENLATLARRRPEAAARLRVARGSWFEALAPDLAGTIHLVVSNPPYVSETEWASLEPVVRDHEPVAALVPGPTGLEAIDLILAGARRWLAPGGGLVVEIAPGQARAVTDRTTALGYEQVDVRDDLAGRPRVLVARSPHQ